MLGKEEYVDVWGTVRDRVRAHLIPRDLRHPRGPYGELGKTQSSLRSSLQWFFGFWEPPVATFPNPNYLFEIAVLGWYAPPCIHLILKGKIW